MINIILADDHHIVRNGIRNLLEKEADINIAGEALTSEEALQMLKNTSADIVLADMNMPGASGIELVEKLKAAGNPVKMMLLTMHDHQHYINKAFQAGVSAYLIKSISPEELLFAIRQVHSGRKYLCTELSLRLLDQAITSPVAMEDDSTKVEFSGRELAILTLIAEGYTNQEIADKLFTSKRTVEGHRQSMIDKAGVRNTPSLVRYAIRHGIIK